MLGCDGREAGRPPADLCASAADDDDRVIWRRRSCSTLDDDGERKRRKWRGRVETHVLSRPSDRGVEWKTEGVDSGRAEPAVAAPEVGAGCSRSAAGAAGG